MAINLIDKIKHASGGPVVDAADVEMPDGQRLSQWSPALPVLPGAETIEPETYYQFGDVDELAVELAETDDGKAHEYVFEFIPSEAFAGLTITPAPVWLREPQYPAGKRCIVSIVQGLAVMGCG